MGMPKTGTTAFQKSLNANRDLLARLGVGLLARDPGVRGVKGSLHHRFAMAYRERISYRSKALGVGSASDRAAAREQSLDAIGSLLAEYPQVLISSEHLAILSPHELARLAEDVRGLTDDVQVICWVRRQDYLVNSFLSQRIKASRWATPTVDFARRPDNAPNISAFIKSLIDVFGSDAVDFRPYLERYKREPDAILSAVMSKLSIDIADAETRNQFIDPPPGVNQSLSMQAAAILDVLTPHIPRHDEFGKANPAVRLELIRYLLAEFPGPSVTVDPEAMHYVVETVLPTNEGLRGAHPAALWQEWFEQPIAPSGTLPSADPKTIASVMATLAVPHGFVEWGGVVRQQPPSSRHASTSLGRRIRRRLTRHR